MITTCFTFGMESPTPFAKRQNPAENRASVEKRCTRQGRMCNKDCTERHPSTQRRADICPNRYPSPQGWPSSSPNWPPRPHVGGVLHAHVEREAIAQRRRRDTPYGVRPIGDLPCKAFSILSRCYLSVALPSRAVKTVAARPPTPTVPPLAPHLPAEPRLSRAQARVTLRGPLSSAVPPARFATTPASAGNRTETLNTSASHGRVIEHLAGRPDPSSGRPCRAGGI